MTIQNQQPQPQPGQPFVSPPGRPMPASVYQQQRGEQMGEIPTSPLPAQKYKGQAPLVPIRAAPRRKRRMRAPVGGLLLVLTGWVGVGGMASFFAMSNGTGSKDAQGVTVTGSGAFVRPPLSPTQVEAIMHLSGYMKDKALASLYVSRMTLDEELGQLIMVEYADGCGSSSGVCPGATSYYSSDLDTMINTLHAGGVIMYE